MTHSPTSSLFCSEGSELSERAAAVLDWVSCERELAALEAGDDEAAKSFAKKWTTAAGSGQQRGLWFYRTSSGSLAHTACQHGKRAFIQLLLVEERPRIFSKNNRLLSQRDDFVNENTPAHLACSHGHTEVVQQLLALPDGRDYLLSSAKNSNGDTPAHLACSHGHTEVVQQLLGVQWGADKFLDVKNSNSETPVDKAVTMNHLCVLEALWQHSGWEMGRNLAHMACAIGNVNVITWLLAQPQGPSCVMIDAKDIKGSTPALLAKQAGNNNIMELLMFTYSHACAAEGDVKQLRKLVQDKGRGCLLSTDVGGYTVAHHGARHVAILRYLQEEGISLDVRANDGRTAAHVAAQEGSVESLQIVQMAAGKNAHAALNACDNKNRTPLWFAYKNKNQHVVAFLFGLSVGCGDAQDLAKTDLRPVVGLEWYHQPLRNLLGRILCHSFIVAKVRDAESKEEDCYILEKMNSSHFSNGVVLSFWSTAASALPNEREMFRSLEQEDINPELKTCTMKDLWAIAHSGGPYKSYSTCHHAARLVYNFCAKADLQTEEMPDKVWCGIAETLNAWQMPLEKLLPASQACDAPMAKLASEGCSECPEGACESLIQLSGALHDEAADRAHAEFLDLIKEVTQRVGEEVPGLGAVLRTAVVVHARFRARQEVSDLVKELVLSLQNLAKILVKLQTKEGLQAEVRVAQGLASYETAESDRTTSQKLKQALADAGERLRKVPNKRPQEAMEEVAKIEKEIDHQIQCTQLEDRLDSEILSLQLQLKAEKEATSAKAASAASAFHHQPASPPAQVPWPLASLAKSCSSMKSWLRRSLSCSK